MYCGHCGKKMAATDAAFCEHCGQPVSQTAAEKAGLNIKASGEKLKEKLKDVDLSEAKKVKDKVTKKGKAVLSDAKKLKKTAKPLSKKSKTIIGGIAGVVVVAVLLIVLIPMLGIGKEPILIVEDGALVYYDNVSDEEGIVVDMNFGDLDDFSDATANAVGNLSRFAQFSEDGNYVFYFTGDASQYTGTHDLMQIDLKKVKRNEQRYATKLIASNVSEFRLEGDMVFYEQCEKHTDGDGSYYEYPLGFYSIEADSNHQITADYSDISDYDRYVISEAGKCVLYGEENGLYLFDTTTQQKKSLAADAEVTYCSGDLTQIVYVTDDEVYLATTESGEILRTECLFTVPLTDADIMYADTSVVSYYGYNSNDEMVDGVYKDGITTTLGNDGAVVPLGLITSVKSSDSVTRLNKGNTAVFGLEWDDESALTLLDNNLQKFKPSMKGSFDGLAWDPDHEILYMCCGSWDNDSDYYSIDLYAYPMIDGAFTGEKLIATDCSPQIYYDSGTKCLFYYDDYDENYNSGTLCTVFDGEFQFELVKNASIERFSLRGLQFNSANRYILCWADVEGRKGDLYALDMSAAEPVIPLGTSVGIDSWGIYDDKIMFIGNYNEKNGGTLFSFDGEEVARERENVMAIITDSDCYWYLEFDG